METTETCQLWTGPRDKDGYGLVRVAGVTARVSRVIWKEQRGEIPAGLHVLHRCDQPACVNLAHLFLGTHQDNMSDMVTKGRSHHPLGERNGRAQLTQKLVDELRKLHAEGTPAKRLSKIYGIARGTLYHLLAGRTWA